MAGCGEETRTGNGAGEPDGGAEERPFIGLPVNRGALPAAQEGTGFLRSGIEPVVQEHHAADGIRGAWGSSVRCWPGGGDAQGGVLGLAAGSLVERQRTLHSGRGGFSHGKQFNAVEAHGDGDAVVGDRQVLPRARDQVLAGESFLAGHGAAFQLCAGQDFGVGSSSGGDFPGRGTAEHNAARRVQFQQQSSAWAAAAEEQAGPPHHRPEAGLQSELPDARARDGKERRARNTKGAVQDVQRSPAACRPVDPVGAPPAVRKSGTEHRRVGPGAGVPVGVTHAYTPAVIRVLGQAGSTVRDSGLARRRDGPGRPELGARRVLDGDFVAGLPGGGGSGVLRLAQLPAKHRMPRRSEARREPVGQQAGSLEFALARNGWVCFGGGDAHQEAVPYQARTGSAAVPDGVLNGSPFLPAMTMSANGPQQSRKRFLRPKSGSWVRASQGMMRGAAGAHQLP